MPAQTLVVTIARQLGSGGSFVGQRVARRLGMTYVDRAILQRAAERLGTDERSIADRGERLSRFWESLVAVAGLAGPEGFAVPPAAVLVPDSRIMETEADAIRRLAAECDSVIVGRGGFHVLAGRPGAVHVFLHAPLAFRVRRVRELYGESFERSRALVEHVDRDRERFIRALAGRSQSDATNYHLSLDTAVAGFDLAERMIVDLVERARALSGAS